MNGERLKKIREILDINQRKFGEHFGVGQKAISHYEKNEREIPVEIILLLNKVFSINLNWFYTGNGSIFMYDLSEDEINDHLKNKKIVDLMLEDIHLQVIFSILENNPVLKDILYLLLKSDRDKSPKIEEYLQILQKYLTSDIFK